ncbi:unnamed protein product [Symbiodinium sp. KB8]|nr:unnamed protein product [Symbiodinium sp. KB8]
MELLTLLNFDKFRPEDVSCLVRLPTRSAAVSVLVLWTAHQQPNPLHEETGQFREEAINENLPGSRWGAILDLPAEAVTRIRVCAVNCLGRGDWSHEELEVTTTRAKQPGSKIRNVLAKGVQTCANCANPMSKEPGEAAYAQLVCRSVFQPDCKHGPFCPKCRERVAQKVLSCCVCRGLIESWRQVTTRKIPIHSQSQNNRVSEHTSVSEHTNSVVAMSWANAHVARLAEKAPPEDICGLVVVCSWPMPQPVLEQYELFREKLAAAMPKEAYVYPGTTLHCTICTLRAFTSGRMESSEKQRSSESWSKILDAARRDPGWPTGPVALKMGRPTLEGSAGIFRYEDTAGTIAAMRKALRAAIIAAGGEPAEGGGDRSKAKPPSGTPEGEPAPHIPDIVHSTVLRWTAEPADRAAAQEAFAQVAESWEPVEIIATAPRAVFEDIPYMHIPDDAEHTWWRSSA